MTASFEKLIATGCLVSSLLLASCGGSDEKTAGSGERPNEVQQQMNGDIWMLSPNEGEAFQGSGVLILANASNSNDMKFEKSRLTIRCPTDWGGPSNAVWSASIDTPFNVAYDTMSKERGTMTIDVDGKNFNAVQFSRTSFNVKAEETEAFRDAVLASAGKTMTMNLKTVDGKEGSSTTTLPAMEELRTYFAENCTIPAAPPPPPRTAE